MVFKLLQQINRTPGINQRALSAKSGISLGKVNSDIENLEFNDFIEKEIKGREYKYYITKKGTEFLENQLIQNQNIQLKLHKNESVTVKKAVILSAGRNKNFDQPVSLLNINEVALIERTIEVLKSIGIEEIIVVVGYKGEFIKEKLGNEITIIENSNYKWTGTMDSLSKTYPFIDEDFLLIEGDIVIEKQGLDKVKNYKDRDCMLITAESGSGDEGFVELREGKVFKISKDIAQLNQIDGEMVGISKISYEFFTKMMEQYENNKNPYMNYEYMMLDVSRQYSLGYVKIDNLLWHEIDNIEHYNYIREKLISKIERKEKSVLLKNLREIICDTLKVTEDKIEDISPIGGMTNKNYKIIVNGESLVLRVPGNGTEDMISRTDEIKNAVYANKIGVDAELVYFNEKTGVKIAKFIENAETLSQEGSKKQHTIKMVCDILRKLHQCEIPMETSFDIYNKIEKYEILLEKANGKYYDDYERVRSEVFALKNITDSYKVKYTPCHNDTLAENFIMSGENKLYLIDWEYGGMNDPMWDIAAYCLENNFSEDEEELFLNIYFNGDIKEEFKVRVLINKIYQDFLWSIWTVIKEARGDDFGTYGIDRYNRAISNLKKIKIKE